MGFLQRITDKFKTKRQEAAGKKELLAEILHAAGDGKLTDEEVQSLETQFKELGLSRRDLGSVRVQAYNAALAAAKADGAVSAEEEAELHKLQQFLMLVDTDIAHSKKELARLRVLNEIREGNLPTVSVSNLVVQRNESVHWSEPGRLFEERVVGRRYEGGSRGVSIRIAKGLSYRVGSQRGQLITDKAIVPVSSGSLVLTSKRVIFRGDAKSYNLRLDKILDIEVYSDGLKITDEKGKPRLVQFHSSSNGEVVGMVLSHTINHFGGNP